MTERVPPLLQPFIRKFYSYSDHPLSLGISDFCAHDQNGDGFNDPNEVEFPFVLMLKPVYNTESNTTEYSAPGNGKEETLTNVEEETDDTHGFDSFIDELLIIPRGSVLFDIYACPNPSSALDASLIQRIGQITSTSKMVISQHNDGLFFRHQKKEEDFLLRPHWREEVNSTCVTKCGKVEGTVGKLIGATFLESNINELKFVDYE